MLAMLGRSPKATKLSSLRVYATRIPSSRILLTLLRYRQINILSLRPLPLAPGSEPSVPSIQDDQRFLD